MEGKFNYSKYISILLISPTILLGIPLIIHRGLHGEYGFDIHGFSILVLGSIPFIGVYLLRGSYFKLSFFALCLLAVLLSTGVVLYYLSSHGLWCAQHPNVTREMCAKLKQFALFASSANVRSWWLTLGDLLAVQRGRAMPMAWEHDIDVCIDPEEFPLFEKALASRAGFFDPKAFRLGKSHWYLPVDMEKLGLRARDAEGVNIDIWKCERTFQGNISRVVYCDGWMNVPGSWEDRHALLTKEYGDYSVVTYEHHDTMCRIWNG